ncbi:MAG: nuclear transport factor 2 family protein [Pyrinomonadaceae bacterium]
MKRIFSIVIALLMTTLVLKAQTAPDANELTRLLKEFLAGASRNDAATHDRFWAEELIYTGSAGRRRGKADVMHDVRSAPAPKPDDPTTVYSAEDIRIQQYGNFAVVAFRLIGTTERGGKTEISNFLNTGTFLKRKGKWQVVAWQATRLPKSEEETKKEVAATEAAFHQAMLSSDVKKLESLTDESFIWTHRTGQQMTRQQLLDEIGSGQRKYAKLETNDVKVWVYGDTGVVRGVSPRQRASTPGASGSGDAAPFKAFYTLTFVNKDGAWKAVAMHTSWTQ